MSKKGALSALLKHKAARDFLFSGLAGEHLTCRCRCEPAPVELCLEPGAGPGGWPAGVWTDCRGPEQFLLKVTSFSSEK